VAKVAVVTGGAGALGRAVCAWFDRAGYSVFLNGISESERENYRGPGQLDIVDLSIEDQCRKWAATLPERVHAAALIAGGFSMKPIVELDSLEIEKMMAMNLLSAALTLSALTPKLTAADGASVVMVGSQAYTGAPGMAAYAAAKAAVVSLAASASIELKKHRVRVNSILPDVIDTPANRAAMPGANFDEWQKPEEIAEVIGFLCSDSARVITGNALRLGR